MTQGEQAKDEGIKDPRATIAKDLTVQVLARLEGLVVSDLEDAGEAVGRLYRRIYRAVDEAMREAETPTGSSRG